MKITGIETYLMNAARSGGGWQSRNWLFVKVQSDEGVYGIGESSGWAACSSDCHSGPDPHIDRG